MRPIDADALKEKINTTFWSEIGTIIDNAPTVALNALPSAEAADVYKAHEEEHLNIVNRIKELQYAIAKTQTIVGKVVKSADRPTGEWIDVNGDGSLWRCDQCKDTACCKGNFCPTCGARMKGNEKKEENNDVHKVPLYAYASWDRSEE